MVDFVQELLEGVGGSDASGNPILGDFGKWFTGKVILYTYTTKSRPLLYHLT